MFDRGLYDLYHDLRFGQTSRVTFAYDTDAVLALPFERYAEVSTEIEAAIATADAKLATAHKRFCVGQKDADVRTLCDPSSLIHPDAALAAARD